MENQTRSDFFCGYGEYEFHLVRPSRSVSDEEANRPHAERKGLQGNQQRNNK
ncbi:hypothetical protein P4621_20740 [Priestia aryabhattai]|uniref:hypothetical protein n=1 Tax=Priestia aryabhattai TaxID=412384 RepID=UPI002E23DE40|nr:hypothetical protein [Priestia aryabhattai]